jgi:hypothetical protein
VELQIFNHSLHSIVVRSVRDGGVAGLSADSRFIIAYDAARTLSLMIVGAAGELGEARAPGMGQLWGQVGKRLREIAPEIN